MSGKCTASRAKGYLPNLLSQSGRAVCSCCVILMCAFKKGDVPHRLGEERHRQNRSAAAIAKQDNASVVSNGMVIHLKGSPKAPDVD